MRAPEPAKVMALSCGFHVIHLSKT